MKTNYCLVGLSKKRVVKTSKPGKTNAYCGFHRLVGLQPYLGRTSSARGSLKCFRGLFGLLCSLNCSALIADKFIRDKILLQYLLFSKFLYEWNRKGLFVAGFILFFKSSCFWYQDLGISRYFFSIQVSEKMLSDLFF